MRLQASPLRGNRVLRDHCVVPAAENVDVPSQKPLGALVLNVRRGTVTFKACCGSTPGDYGVEERRAVVGINT